jgi:putative endonuclease
MPYFSKNLCPHNPKVVGSNPTPATNYKRLMSISLFLFRLFPMFYVYIIKSREGKYYIGSTDNIEYRLQLHNSKKFPAWTNRYNEWKLVYSESFDSRSNALKREKTIKNMKGGLQFKSLVGS